MILAVRPDSLRRLDAAWDDAAGVVSSQSETLAAVSAGSGNFGRINQFMTPMLKAFVWAATAAVEECGEQLRGGALASRDTANDMEQTDAEVSENLGEGCDSCL